MWYPFALPAKLDADQLEQVLDVGRWISAGVQFAMGKADILPPNVPTTVREQEEAIHAAARLVLPTVPEDVLNQFGRDQQALMVSSFLAYATGRLSTLPPSGSVSPNRNERRRSRSSK